ncbi:hypothetical protein GGI19_001240 [Coemansia pectinata]|uniref:Eukaryotic translation initiation factor 2-alpha kinase 1 n=1 Tax=Coemansia pectinata TaxID=1052879 RepID=A0A9W8GY04_9FUNG|nr:hypothetical protein GGI19_001240 [Coemansia pectinata]
MLIPNACSDPDTTNKQERHLSSVCDSSADDISYSRSLEDSQAEARQLVLQPRTLSSVALAATAAVAEAGSLGREQQTRILFVTLLESYLRTYDDDPLRNRRLFFAICRTLYSMGIIGKEYVDEMASVRATYSGAFRELVMRAQQSLDMYEQHDIESGIRSLVTSMTEESESLSLDYSLSTDGVDECSVYGQQKYATVPASRTPKPPLSSCSNGSSLRDIRWLRSSGAGSRASSSNTSNTFDTMIMDMQRSRYHDDFIQLRTLGRGGFGRVFEARNKLDGRRYAVKQIKVKGQITADKTLRETKTLASLEHPNIVRYYSSWIEVAQQRGRKPIGASSSLGPDEYCVSPAVDEESDEEEEEEEEETGDDDVAACDNACGEKRRFDMCDGSLSPSLWSLSSSGGSEGEVSADPPPALVGLFAGGLPSSSRRDRGWFDDDEANVDLVPASPFGDNGSQWIADDDIVFENSKSGPCDSSADDGDDEHIVFTEDCNTVDSVSSTRLNTVASTRSCPIPIKNAFHRRQRSLLVNDSTSLPSDRPHQLLAQSLPGSNDSTYSMVVGETTLYIQMQMCQTTLQQFIVERNRRIDAQSLLIDPVLNIRLFRAIVEGVRYFHTRGVIHRDLKGANVFVDVVYADSGGNPISRCASDIGRPGDCGLEAVMRDVHAEAWDTIDGGNLKERCSSEAAMAADTSGRNIDWDSVFASILASRGGPTPELSTASLLPEDDAAVPMVTLIPRIGDFGLATKTITQGIQVPSSDGGGNSPLTGDTTESSMVSHLPKHHRRTSNVGTITYAAPEQLLNQQSVVAYSEKADIYSLGIIFFELYYAFSTSMERVIVIRDLRRGVFPEEFIRAWPQEAAFISRLMDTEPGRRPSAKEILAMDLLDVPSVESARLKREVAGLKQQLRMACLRNEELGLRVRELERIVDQCTI